MIAERKVNKEFQAMIKDNNYFNSTNQYETDSNSTTMDGSNVTLSWRETRNFTS